MTGGRQLDHCGSLSLLQTDAVSIDGWQLVYAGVLHCHKLPDL